MKQTDLLWGVALLATGALSACRSESLTPSAPTSRPGMRNIPELPSMPVSIVDAPISYALEPALTALEQAVPTRFGDLDKRVQIPGNKRQQVAFAATRTPFAVKFDGQKLTLTTTVSYTGRGWYKPVIGPTLSASCGTDNSPPRLNVVLSTDIGLNPEWILESRSRVASLRASSSDVRDACLVTFLKIDVTDQVIRAVRPLLASKLPALDRKIAAFDVRKRVEKWYGMLQRPIRVRDSLWLELSPEQLRLGEFSLQDSALVATIRLYAHPRLVAGPQPIEPTSPLPPLSPALKEVGDSARIRIEGLLPYDVASSTLSRELIGRKFRRFGRSVRLDSIAVSPLDDGRVVLAVRVSGDIDGTAYLVGTPQLDQATRALIVPDLDFDVSTSNALVQGLAWLRKGDMVAQLRKQARFPLDTILEETRTKVEGALNRDLTSGVELSGTVRTGRLLDVLVHPRWLVVRAEAAGTLALAVDRPIKVKKKISASR
ncbi:DUF4403 family protein [Gemmatimonas sp.]|uniref:DUF4403 family protein n=1 Tax=Gemmatimonas sp. TaxID=1962908 RepID=UPI00286C565D|nr:DUF4403 family protein [Gemmatimonas sp.]